METVFNYGTLSEAINKLRERGFTVDFNLERNCIVCEGNKFSSEEFEIVELYRYEGASDPADEAMVYAIESESGIKGILVSGYGISTDSLTAKMIEKLKFRKNPLKPV